MIDRRTVTMERGVNAGNADPYSNLDLLPRSQRTNPLTHLSKSIKTIPNSDSSNKMLKAPWIEATGMCERTKNRQESATYQEGTFILWNLCRFPPNLRFIFALLFHVKFALLKKEKKKKRKRKKKKKKKTKKENKKQCGINANVLECEIVVSEFELQSHDCDHFRTNTLGKSLTPCHGSNSTATVLRRWLRH